MPFSDTATHEYMCQFFTKCENTVFIRVLDCGMGSGLVAKSIRDRFPDCSILITGLEIHLPYIINWEFKKPKYHDLYNSIIGGGKGDMVDFLFKTDVNEYDIIIFGDSLEHLSKDVAKLALDRAYRVATYGVVVNIPINGASQGPRFGNENEKHRSQWTRKEIEGLGGIYNGGNKNVGCFVWSK